MADMDEVTSLSAKIAEKLELDILTGQLSPGDRLDERGLARRFKASRTPVREALQRLSADGLVQMNGRKGTYVARLTLTQLLDSFRVVSELEALAAAQASKRITKDQIVAMHQHQNACEEAFAADDAEAFCVANDLLHNTILEASGNWMLGEQLRSARILAPYRRHITYQTGRMESSIAEHKAVIESIESGDSATAAAQMRCHVNALADGLSDFLYFLSQSGQTDIIALKQ